jgi:molybdopterin-guanine dinucleotide biosynthesis protein A
MAAVPVFDAIVIAGGRATRLGGVDKTALTFQGRTLLQCALNAVTDARHVVVVGSEFELAGVIQTSEEPRWAGPAAALAAGVLALPPTRTEFTAVVAADLPRVGDALALLLAAKNELDGVIAVDSTGARQQLLGVYRSAALRRVIAASGPLTNAPLRRITGMMRLREVAVPDDLCADIDSPIDALRHGITLPTLARAG